MWLFYGYNLFKKVIFFRKHIILINFQEITMLKYPRYQVFKKFIEGKKEKPVICVQRKFIEELPKI